jgi:L-aminopeptidase/D-esterase-like protein
VFSGGSTYSEEAITAVETGLKDDGVRSGKWTDIALVAGAIIYDFNPGLRFNEIYPDKRLAQAALHALRRVFPLGAQGAGRMAMQEASLDASHILAGAPPFADKRKNEQRSRRV